MSEIHFIDTTLRDGSQSLWAMNMPTHAMLSIAEQMDKGGFEFDGVLRRRNVQEICT